MFYICVRQQESVRKCQDSTWKIVKMSDFYDFQRFYANFPLCFAYFPSNLFLKYIILHPVETTLFRDNEMKLRFAGPTSTMIKQNRKSN